MSSDLVCLYINITFYSTMMLACYNKQSNGLVNDMFKKKQPYQ